MWLYFSISRRNASPHRRRAVTSELRPGPRQRSLAHEGIAAMEILARRRCSSSARVTAMLGGPLYQRISSSKVAHTPGPACVVRCVPTRPELFASPCGNVGHAELSSRRGVSIA